MSRRDDDRLRTDDVFSDDRDTPGEFFAFDEQSGLMVPVVGAQARALSKSVKDVIGAARRRSRRGGRGGRGAQRSQQAQQQAQQQPDQYDDGYGGYGPYYGGQMPPQAQDASQMYPQSYPFASSALAQEGYYGPAPTAAQPYPYAQPTAAQEGWAYDPASGTMQPYYGDPATMWDPNDPNSLYSRMQSQGYSQAEIAMAMQQSGASPYQQTVVGQTMSEEEGC